MVVKKLDKKMIANIKSYSSQIKTFTSLVGVVRQTPSRFIGGMGNKGHLNTVREIIQNSIDELLRINSPCDNIVISYDARTLTTIVEDNGRGIPHNIIITVFTDDKTSTNYDKQKGDYSAGAHGTGSTITNALCSSFIVESYIIDEAKKVIFKDFIPESEPLDIPFEKGKHGTRITFTPSIEALGDITTSEKDVSHLIKTLMPLTNIGNVIEFNYIDNHGKKGKEKFINRDGILSILINNTDKPLMKPISIQHDTGEVKSDILFTYDTDENAGESIVSYSNFCYTIYGGTHVAGYMEGMRKFFKEYMNKIYLANTKKKITIFLSGFLISNS